MTVLFSLPITAGSRIDRGKEKNSLRTPFVAFREEKAEGKILAFSLPPPFARVCVARVSLEVNCHSLKPWVSEMQCENWTLALHSRSSNTTLPYANADSEDHVERDKVGRP